MHGTLQPAEIHRQRIYAADGAVLLPGRWCPRLLAETITPEFCPR